MSRADDIQLLHDWIRAAEYDWRNDKDGGHLYTSMAIRSDLLHHLPDDVEVAWQSDTVYDNDLVAVELRKVA